MLELPEISDIETSFVQKAQHEIPLQNFMLRIDQLILLREFSST